MRITTLILALFFQSFAQASVGEWSYFTGSAALGCGSKSSSMESRYTVTAENEDLKSRTVLIQESFEGTITTKEGSLPFVSTDTLDDEYKLRSFCKKISGVIEGIQVPAGTFQSCKVSAQNEDGWDIETWVGNVPMAVLAWKGTKDAFGDQSCVQTVDQKLKDFRAEQ